MEKLIFKNAYLNAVLGFALILFAVLAYFLKWVEDFLPIIVGVVLILLFI